MAEPWRRWSELNIFVERGIHETARSSLTVAPAYKHGSQLKLVGSTMRYLVDQKRNSTSSSRDKKSGVHRHVTETCIHQLFTTGQTEQPEVEGSDSPPSAHLPILHNLVHLRDQMTATSYLYGHGCSQLVVPFAPCFLSGFGWVCLGTGRTDSAAPLKKARQGYVGGQEDKNTLVLPALPTYEVHVVLDNLSCV